MSSFWSLTKTLLIVDKVRVMGIMEARSEAKIKYAI